MIKLRKSVVVATVLGTAVVGGGVAYAYVVTSGHGRTTAPVASPASSITITPTISASLAPGTTVPVAISVRNTGQSKIGVNTVYVSIPTAQTCGDTITVAEPSVTAPLVIPAGATTTITGAAIAMSDSDTVDQTGCLGNPIDVDVAVS